MSERNDYLPFGGRWEVSGTAITDNRFRFSGKEDQTTGNLPYQDFGARFLGKKLSIWTSIDPLAQDCPGISPYAYCNNNPVSRIDPDGKWDIKVHVYNDRTAHEYGIAVVTDRHGNEVQRFDVRAEGVRGRDRNIMKADTPLGVYDIPAEDTWRSSTSTNRKSYGPNQRLVMNPESGEIVNTGRDEIRIHGGRQEDFNPETNSWTPSTNPTLLKTEGCLRAYDSDMATLKETIMGLQQTDFQEYPGKVTIVDDLQKAIVPASNINMIEVKTIYQIPQTPTFPTFGGR